jgi:hypothetical protein
LIILTGLEIPDRLILVAAFHAPPGDEEPDPDPTGDRRGEGDHRSSSICSTGNVAPSG